MCASVDVGQVPPIVGIAPTGKRGNIHMRQAGWIRTTSSFGSSATLRHSHFYPCHTNSTKHLCLPSSTPTIFLMAKAVFPDIHGFQFAVDCYPRTCKGHVLETQGDRGEAVARRIRTTVRPPRYSSGPYSRARRRQNCWGACQGINVGAGTVILW